MFMVVINYYCHREHFKPDTFTNALFLLSCYALLQFYYAFLN
ncbi:unnamed protein product [Schistosoma curassoni]|uniref:Very-long-chain 3-oxoacyl-CoA synthase n=1 Tax=Schistosoma curassoni TaxID=6186 RepID=A0A183KY09_9TREM|nr:unnamed protein product [Schistosoma curassoni]